jgi:aryl-alcohol dehydrogenase-like predicted oxidoreductase
MEMRVFGRTGMQLSVLGFGCGAVGGLMVRGDPLDQERTIARAIAVGVNYFDTAVQYGNGESEKNLGRVLQRLKAANVAFGTKVRLPSSDFDRIADAVAKSLEGSLARLRLDRIDIFHLHNAITETGGGDALSVRQVLSDVVPAFEQLRQQGKTRFLGFTAVGDTAALRQVIDACIFDSAQVVYNMLNPSAAGGLPANYPAQDYGRLFDHTRAAGVGVVGIRVLAGGAPVRIGRASSDCESAARADRHGYDLRRRCGARPPSDAAGKEGFAASLTEAATRFALSHPAMGTILVGMAAPQQFEDALAAVQKGPLPAAALDRISADVKDSSYAAEHVASDDVSLYLGRSFENAENSGVANVAFERKGFGVTEPAMDLQREIRDPARGFGRKQLGHRGFGREADTFRACPRRLVGQELRRLERSGHVGEHPLDALVLGDLVRERHPLFRPRNRGVERRPAKADAHGGDVHPAAVENRHGDLETPAELPQQILGRDVTVEIHLVNPAAADAHDRLGRRGRCATGGRVNDERAHTAAARLVARSCKDDEEVGFTAIGDEMLGAADPVTVSVGVRARHHAGGIRPRPRFGQRVSSQLFPRCRGGKKTLLLLVASAEPKALL